jgi:hypothetical protein
MKRIIRFGKEFGLSILSLGLPFLAAAQTSNPGAQPTLPTGSTPFASGIVSAQGVLNFVCTIFSWMFYFLIVLAIVFVVIAAYKYLFSGGSPEKTKGAQNALLYAAIAVAVALLAKGIPSIVASFLGASNSSGGGFLAC